MIITSFKTKKKNDHGEGLLCIRKKKFWKQNMFN